MSRSYTSSPPCASMACSGTPLPLHTYITDGTKEEHILTKAPNYMQDLILSRRMNVIKFSRAISRVNVESTDI
jgi:hypothetical protein